MRNQGRNGLAAVAQRRQREEDNIQTVAEGDAKFTPIHHFHQVTVRRRYQPNVHLVGMSSAQTLELLFLQDAQQLGLQCRGNIAHLVQEERALIGHFEATDLLRDGSGKGALLMAKQLAFQQIEGDGSAVQLYERTPAPQTDVVNRSRNQLFSGACFSMDQYGRIGRRHSLDLFKEGFQRTTLAYDL